MNNVSGAGFEVVSRESQKDDSFAYYASKNTDGILSWVSLQIEKIADFFNGKSNNNDIFKKTYAIPSRKERAKVVDALLVNNRVIGNGLKKCDRNTHEEIAEQLNVLKKHYFVKDYSENVLPAFEAYVKKVPSSDMYGRHGIMPILIAMKSLEKQK